MLDVSIFRYWMYGVDCDCGCALIIDIQSIRWRSARARASAHRRREASIVQYFEWSKRSNISFRSQCWQCFVSRGRFDHRTRGWQWRLCESAFDILQLFPFAPSLDRFHCAMCISMSAICHLQRLFRKSVVSLRFEFDTKLFSQRSLRSTPRSDANLENRFLVHRFLFRFAKLSFKMYVPSNDVI